MAGLRDQLLKSGLVTEKQVKQVRKEQTKAQKASGHRAQDKDVGTQNADKIQRDRELNQQQQAERQRKDLEAQVRQLIVTRRLKLEEGDHAFNFTDAGKIKKLHLTQALRDQLIRGLIGIVRNEGRYELVPRETIEKIEQRNRSCIVLFNDKPNDTLSDPEDPYAKFQVPDDLIW